MFVVIGIGLVSSLNGVRRRYLVLERLGVGFDGWVVMFDFVCGI